MLLGLAGLVPLAAPRAYEVHEPADGAASVAFFDLRAAFPVDDFQMGGRLGVGTATRLAWDFFLDFEMRPYRRAVRVRESDVLEYQFREQRFTIGPGALARLPLGDQGAFYTVGGGVGLSPAWYRGSNREAPSRALGWLETGFRFVTPGGADWGFAYQFFPLPGVSSHRAAIHVGFRAGSR